MYALADYMFNISEKLSFLIQITNNAPVLRSNTYWYMKQAKQAAQESVSSASSKDGGSRERVQVKSLVPAVNPAHFPECVPGDTVPEQVVEIGSRRQVLRQPLKRDYPGSNRLHANPTRTWRQGTCS